VLADTQRRLRALWTTPGGVAEALREAGDPEGRSLEGFVRSDARAPARDRLEVYANAWFQRLLGALKGDFGALAAQAGDAGINDVVLAYLIAEPPRHASLRHAGDRLAGYLADDPRAAPFRRRWPWCADLARFELALLDAFDAADAPVLARAALAALPPEDWPALVLRVQPCVQVLELAWPVAPLREGFERGVAAPPPAAPVSNWQLVWRRDEVVRWRESSPVEAELIARARAGECFEEICAAASRALGDDAAPAHAAALLARWVDAGMLAA
jgi:hypothetical protein